MSDRKPRSGKSTLLQQDWKLEIPPDFGGCQIMLKSVGRGAARVLVTRDDGAEPKFNWDASLPGFNLTIGGDAA